MAVDWGKYSSGPAPKRNAISAGLSSGVDDLQGLGYSGIAALADTIGADGVKDWANEQADRNQWESQKNGRPDLERVEDVAGSPSKWLPYLGYQVGKQLPNIVGGIAAGAFIPEVAVPAGLSRLAAVAPKWMGGGAAGAAEGFAAKKAAVEAGERLASQLTGGAAWNYGQSVGSLYQAAQDGGDMENAGLKSLIGGVPYALMETAPEAMLAARVMGGGHAFNGNLATRMAKAGGMQAASGATSELGQTAMENAYNGNMTDEQKASSYLNAGVAGGLVEGLLGMSGSIRSRARAIESGKPSDLLAPSAPPLQLGLSNHRPNDVITFPDGSSVLRSEYEATFGAGGPNTGAGPKDVTNTLRQNAIKKDLDAGKITLEEAKQLGYVTAPEFTTSQGFEGLRGGLTHDWQTDLTKGVIVTPDWSTSLGAGGLQVGQGIQEMPGAITRALGEPEPNTGVNPLGSQLQMPAVPGRPGLADTMVAGAPSEIAATPADVQAMGDPGTLAGMRAAQQKQQEAQQLAEQQAAVKAEKARVDEVNQRAAGFGLKGKKSLELYDTLEQLKEKKAISEDDFVQQVNNLSLSAAGKVNKFLTERGFTQGKDDAKTAAAPAQTNTGPEGISQGTQPDTAAGGVPANTGTANAPVTSSAPAVVNQSGQGALTTEANANGQLTLPSERKVKLQIQHPTNGLVAVTSMSQLPADAITAIDEVKGGKGGNDLILAMNDSGKIKAFKKSQWDLLRLVRGLDEQGHATRTPMTGEQAAAALGLKSRSSVTKALNELLGKGVALKEVKNQVRQENASTAMEAPTAFDTDESGKVTAVQATGKDDLVNDIDAKQEYLAEKADAAPGEELEEDAVLRRIPASADAKPVDVTDARDKFDEIAAVSGHTDWDFGSLSLANKAAFVGKYIAHFDPRLGIDFLNDAYDELRSEHEKQPAAGNTSPKIEAPSAERPQLAVSPEVGERVAKEESRSQKDADVTDVTPKEKPKVTPATPTVIEGSEGSKLVFESQEQVKRAVELQTKKIEKLQALLKCLTGG